MFEDGLDAPEAAAGKNRSLMRFCRGRWRVDGGRGKRRFRSFRRTRAECVDGRPSDDRDDYGEGEAAANVRALHDALRKTAQYSLRANRPIGCAKKVFWVSG